MNTTWRPGGNEKVESAMWKTDSEKGKGEKNKGIKKGNQNATGGEEVGKGKAAFVGR